MKKIFLLLPMLLSAFSTMADDGDIYGVYYNVLIDGIYYNLNNYVCEGEPSPVTVLLYTITGFVLSLTSLGQTGISGTVLRY